MHFFINGLFLVAAFKWGNWRNWQEYYPTILFFILGDLLKNFLFHDYRMWQYQETFFGEKILFSHSVIALLIMLVAYPSTLLLYLGHYPHTWIRQVLWVSFWVMLYSLIEFINLRHLSLINHFHGWTIGWSVAFNVVMFSTLGIHKKSPLLAWGVSVIWIIFLWNIFEVPLGILK